MVPAQAPQPSAAPPPAPVPPPPPPQATLPPVRKAPASAKVASGLGSAKGLRWRGELETERRPSSADHAGEPEATAEEALPIDPDSVARSAPPWLISTIIHLVLLLILALMTTPVGTGLSRVILTIGESSKESDVELTEFAIESSESLSEVDTPIDEPVVDVQVPMTFDAPLLEDAIEEMEAEVGVGPQLDISQPMFAGRTGAMKKALLAMYGGTPETEEAVARGLAWLKRNQLSSGEWSMRGPYDYGATTSENRIAATAMATLAFMGDGNTHEKGEYAAQVEAGLKYLVSQQDRSGFFCKNVRSHDDQAYAQAQATMALSEAYAMTNDSWLRPHAQLAINHCEERQSPEGGWRYQPRFDSDTSVTGWYVMALKSGMAAGLDVSESRLREVHHYLDTAQSYEGAGYAYRPGRPPSPPMTAEGLLCRQYLGWEEGYPPMIRGVEALAYDYGFDLADNDVYYWYYATQVLHHVGGSPWRTWNEAMRVDLPRVQIERGREAGSWAPQADIWGRSQGRLYQTCMSIFCLEVYYRHLPLYRIKAEEKGE